MALKCKIELQSGVILNESYIKIIENGGNKDLQNIRVAFYNSETDYTSGKTVIDSELQSFIPDITDSGLNFIKQGYEYLKNLDRYKDAVDLLDEGQTATQ